MREGGDLCSQYSRTEGAKARKRRKAPIMARRVGLAVDRAREPIEKDNSLILL